MLLSVISFSGLNKRFGLEGYVHLC